MTDLGLMKALCVFGGIMITPLGSFKQCEDINFLKVHTA